MILAEVSEEKNVDVGADEDEDDGCLTYTDQSTFCFLDFMVCN